MGTLKDQVEEALADFWDANCVPESGISDTGVEDMLVPLDSLTACEALLDIEALVAGELPVDQIIRKGGYASKKEFVEEVTKAVFTVIGEKP